MLKVACFLLSFCIILLLLYFFLFFYHYENASVWLFMSLCLFSPLYICTYIHIFIYNNNTYAKYMHIYKHLNWCFWLCVCIWVLACASDVSSKIKLLSSALCILVGVHMLAFGFLLFCFLSVQNCNLNIFMTNNFWTFYYYYDSIFHLFYCAKHKHT